jgi:hypothetical protein
MITVPAVNACTSPVADTVASPVLDDDQVTAAPLITFPDASSAVAFNCTDCPVVRLAVVGETLTDATVGAAGALTVTPAVAFTVPDAAVMVAVPCLTNVTIPDDETVAVAVVDDDHVIVAPEIALPDPSWAVAVSCIASPGTPVIVAGASMIAATVGALTVTPAVAFTAPDAAVMVAVPSLTNVTIPDDETVAVAVVDDDHVIVAPEIALPDASWAVAVSCIAFPGTPVIVAGASMIAATVGALTVTPTVAEMPPSEAVIVAVPCLINVTSPLELTLAADALDDVHDTVCPVTVLPEASLGTAVTCVVVPATPVIDVGESPIDATGAALTVAPMVAVTPLADAVMVAVPCLTRVTSPLEETVATAVLDDDHVTVTPVTGLPFASRSAAVTCALFPGRPVIADGESAIDATGPGGGAVTVALTVDVTPLADAVIVADPCLVSDTIPDDDTVAIDVLEEDQVSVGGVVISAPVESLSTAVICVELPGTPRIAVGDS